MRFVRYGDKHNVFVNKKVLKGKNILTTKSFTKERMRKLKEAKEQYRFQPVWTTDGKILFKKNHSPSIKPNVYCE